MEVQDKGSIVMNHVYVGLDLYLRGRDEPIGQYDQISLYILQMNSPGQIFLQS